MSVRPLALPAMTRIGCYLVRGNYDRRIVAVRICVTRVVLGRRDHEVGHGRPVFFGRSLRVGALYLVRAAVNLTLKPLHRAVDTPFKESPPPNREE